MGLSKAVCAEGMTGGGGGGAGGTKYSAIGTGCGLQQEGKAVSVARGTTAPTTHSRHPHPSWAMTG